MALHRITNHCVIYLDHLEGRVQYVLQIHQNDTDLRDTYHRLRVLRGREVFTA